MTVVALIPSSTVAAGGTVTGAANAHTALSDGSSSSYVDLGVEDAVVVALSDLSLPAGAVVSKVVADIWDLKVSFSPVVQAIIAGPYPTELFSGSTAVTWSALAEHGFVYTAADQSDVSDSDLDDATITLQNLGSGVLRVSEARLLVTYVAKPVTNVTAPAGAVTDTNVPTITWSNTLDNDGGAQTKYEVKIFSAAQYGAGGFDPDTSIATEDSGRFLSSATSRSTYVAPLADGTYRAYVRVAQSVLGVDHWSDWDYSEFTSTANTPGVPTIRAVAEDDEGRIWITVDDTLGALAQAFEVQRSIDNGTTWETIRTLASDPRYSSYIIPASGIGRAYDFEVGNGVTVIYRARALNVASGFPTYSAWSASTTPTAWQSSSWWLKSPLQPDLNIPVEIDGMEALKQSANQGVFNPLGRRVPIVISDVRSGFRSTVRFVCEDELDRADLDELLDLCEPLLLQAPPTDSWDDRYIMLGDLSRARGVDKSWVDWSVDTLPWVEVDAPTGDIVEWPAFAS